jgi:hypothetical protein
MAPSISLRASAEGRAKRAGQAEDALRIAVREQVSRLVVELEAGQVLQAVGGRPGCTS